MDAFTASALGFGAVLLLVALRMPLALALAVVGAVGTGIAKGWGTFAFVAGSAPFEALNHYGLSVIPLFVLMGALAVATGLANDLAQCTTAFLGHRRGGLAMAGVVSCALFGAVSGSNIATLSTMTRITVPEMLRRGYSPMLASGTLASASTLDILIPPSVPMVIYATLTDTSVGRLFAAGIVPGVVLTLMFMIAIQLWVWRNPAIAPRGVRVAWAARLRSLRGVLGVAAVFCLMMIGMYVGIFSPTEAAAVGAAGVLVAGLVQGRMTFSRFVGAVRESVQICAIIFFILMGVTLFHFFMDSIGLQKQIVQAIEGMRSHRVVVMGIILLGLILLGCVMEATSILFITVPLLFPVVVALGYDPIWFGIVMVMVIQLGLIHPPFGLNVFILAAMIKEVSVATAFWGCVPFVIANILIIGLALLVPEMILWLPNRMFN